MQVREIEINKTENQDKDSFALKIVMAILAVAVVVFTLINATPVNAQRATDQAENFADRVVVSRTVHRNTNVISGGTEEVKQGKLTQGEEIFEGVGEISADLAATATNHN